MYWPGLIKIMQISSMIIINHLVTSFISWFLRLVFKTIPSTRRPWVTPAVTVQSRRHPIPTCLVKRGCKPNRLHRPDGPRLPVSRLGQKVESKTRATLFFLLTELFIIILFISCGKKYAFSHFPLKVFYVTKCAKLYFFNRVTLA